MSGPPAYNPFLPPFMNPLPPPAAVVGPAPPAPNPNLHPIGLAFALPFPPAPAGPLPNLNNLAMPPFPHHPLVLPPPLPPAVDPAATRSNSPFEETGRYDFREESYDGHRFTAPMGRRRDSECSSSSSDSDNMGKGSPVRF